MIPCGRSKNATRQQEMDIALGKLRVRIDLERQCVTVYLDDWDSWHVDTEQIELESGVIHFVQPNASVIGIRIDQSAGMASE